MLVWKVKNKQKEAKDGPFFLKKHILLSIKEPHDNQLFGLSLFCWLTLAPVKASREGNTNSSFVFFFFVSFHLILNYIPRECTAASIQCDQIGLFFKPPGNKFSYKNNYDYLATFWAILKKDHFQ